MMRKATEKEIVRPRATRFATNFLTLQSLHQHKPKLRLMFSNSRFHNLNVAKTVKGKRVEAIVMSAGFWKSVVKIIKVFTPLFKLLRIVDIDYKPSMGFVAGIIEDMKEEIRGVYKEKVHDYRPVIDIIEAKAQGRLDSPLHMAAYFLNPLYFYRTDEAAMRSIAAKDGFVDVMKLFYLDMNNQIQISTYELEKYMDWKCSFGRAVAIASCKSPDFNPATWWYMHGRDCPLMQHIALKVFNLTSNSSGCERNWSTFEGMLLDVALVFNKVSLLSQQRQMVKLTQGFIEAFRESYPSSEEVLTLECVWEKDKFVLLERANNSNVKKQNEDQGAFPSETSIKYETTQIFTEAESEHEQNSERTSDVALAKAMTPSEDQSATISDCKNA